MSKPKKPKQVTIGARIEQARTGYRMSQSQLGAMLKVTRAAVSLYEKDRNRPRAEVIDRLAELFGASPEWFTHGHGDAPAAPDLPLTIPEIEAAQITPEVANPARLATSRIWTLPGGVLDGSDQLITIVAPNAVRPVSVGDRVVVDLQQRSPAERPGVFLAYLTDYEHARLYQCGDGCACVPNILGRVVGFFRPI